ncbi:MAG: CUB domain-containing protein, partial [Bacteroidetes bacterium]|nr:CUB domain-containing protein [Candidatus Gallipaludibacter merdavium]
SNMAELYWFAALVNGTLDTVPQETEADAVLTADIVINENVLTAEGELVEETDGLMAWTSMGSESAPFNGTFDGQGHTISGLYINQPKADEQGLFGYVGSSGNVSWIEVTGSYIHGQDGVGGITGINNGLLTACSYSGTVIGYDYPIGGVAGENNGTVSCCYATGKVHATGSDPYVGGVVGDNYGTISSCYSTALLSTDNSGSIGGVASYNDGGPITDSYYSQGSADKGVDENGGTVENVESRTAEQFASGEVTWLLQHAITDDTQIWGQSLPADTLPMLLSEHKVYAALFIHETTSLQMMAKYGNLNAQIPLSTAEELGANGEVSFTDTLGNPLTETITLLSDTVILVNCRLYSITVSNNILNGDISVPYDSYNVGAEVTVEAIPYSGYEPLCLYVQTYDGQEYEYEDFSFTMPAADVVLSADFIPYLYGATYTISEDDNAYNVMLTWDYDASDCHTLIYRDGNLLHTTEVNETSWQEQISEDGVYNYTLYVENAQGVRSRGTLLTVYAYPSTPMGTSGTQSIDLGDVPELFTDDGGRNGNYSNDVDVTTEITAQEDCRIYLTGNYVLEQGYDYLQIYDSDNSRLRECNGMGTIEPALFSSGNTLSVRFTSDGSETYEGFELYVETVYPITIAEVENGTVESDTAWARAGGIVTLTPLPNEQYTYVEGSLKVLKADDPTVEVPVNADGSFTMPAFKITVTATFESSTALSVAETASWNVFGTDGMLHITGTEAEAEVYDVRGVLLYRGMDRNLYMPTGVYIVRAEGQVQKAIVK